MIKADTPNLWEIRNHTDHATAVAIIVTALIHLSRLVNLPKESNLNRDQIGEIANDVIEEYGYLKVEEVKYILKSAVRENKIFGRIDYAVVMQWVRDYANLRAEHCMDISDQEETQAANQPSQDSGARTFDEYVDSLRLRAHNGDNDAKKRLHEIDNPPPVKMRLLTEEEKHHDQLEFFKYRLQFIQNAKRNKTNR